MAAAVSTNSSQGGILALAGFAVSTNSSQGGILALAALPADFAEVTQAGFAAITDAAPQTHISQGGMMVVARGRVDNPRVRAWTFTMDGHDFYVLRLGDDTTLLYDVYSEQWIEWTSPDLPFWRPSSGMNWVGAQRLGRTYGSLVVVGDDTFGLIWFLDPMQGFDDHPDAEHATQQLAFERIVMGQLIATSRQALPCYAIFLKGDNYGLTANDFTPTIKLEISDDEGRTFSDMGTLTVTPDYQQTLPYQWLSLGQITSPGRLFRVTDTGVYTRIDSMDMNDVG